MLDSYFKQYDQVDDRDSDYKKLEIEKDDTFRRELMSLWFTKKFVEKSLNFINWIIYKTLTKSMVRVIF